MLGRQEKQAQSDFIFLSKKKHSSQGPVMKWIDCSMPESFPLQVSVGAQSPVWQKESYIPRPGPASNLLCDLSWASCCSTLKLSFHILKIVVEARIDEVRLDSQPSNNQLPFLW